MSLESNWVFENVLGTCDPDFCFFEGFGEILGITDEYQIENVFNQACNNAGITRCEGCGWWVESYTIQESGFCEDCVEN